jgi:predicted hydrocarbon binding protein
VSNLYPKHLLVAEFGAGRRLIHFLALLTDAPDSFANVSALAAENRINILTGFHAPTGPEGGLWSFFADFTDTAIPPSEFASKMRSLSSVRDVKFQEGNHGFIIDSFNFPPMYGNEPAIVIMRETFSSFLERVRRILGTGPVAGVLLNEMGVSAGAAAYQALKRMLGERGVKEQVRQIFGLYAAAGWGVATVSELDIESKHAIVSIDENFECLPHKGQRSEAHSQFVRGDIAGMLSGILGTRVRCVETLCIAKGDKVCQFSIDAER